MAETLPGVEQARERMRWTGSWYTAFVSVEPVTTWSSALKQSIKTSLNMLRMMGTDLVVEQADMVGLAIAMTICVAPDYFQGDVYAALWQVLVTGDSCTGTPGLLSAENFQFGATVYASPIIAAAQGVPGVVSVHIDDLRAAGFAAAAREPRLPVSLRWVRSKFPAATTTPTTSTRGRLTLTLDGGK